jgi:glycosyltransferase involved in cell wall biosynthesis
MRLLALVPGLLDTCPSQRFRMEQWEPFLRARGVEITFEAFRCEALHSILYKPGNRVRKARLILHALARRIAVLCSLEEFDAVYVLREAALLGPPFFESWIHRAGVPLIFDFDDAIFVPHVSLSNGYLSLLKFPTKTGMICRLASHVMVGNRYLGDYASRFNSRVTIVPTTIDTEKYTVHRPRPASDPIVIGWSGSYSTVPHLDTLRDTLRRLAKQERFRLRIIGAPRYQLPGVDVEALPWRSQTELADLRPIDIGVMPLPDDRWTRGKCGLKALQYMALGIPTVCSPVGVNTEIIRDGQNGVLAATEAEWVQKLTLMLRSAELRKQLGAAGRVTVEERYSARVHVPEVYRILESVVRGRSIPGEPVVGRRPGSRRQGDPCTS